MSPSLWGHLFDKSFVVGGNSPADDKGQATGLFHLSNRRLVRARAGQEPEGLGGLLVRGCHRKGLQKSDPALLIFQLGVPT